MHPILGDRRRLALYLLGWLAIGLLLTAGLSARASWPAAAALFLPLSIVFAFMSLNAGYLCRVFPIDPRATLWRTVIVHVVAAAMVSAIWIAIGAGWVGTLSFIAPDLRAGELFGERRQLLFVIGALLFWLASILHYLLIAFEVSQQAERRAIELSLLTRDAELKALRAQIDPHFLFNSLHSISALTTSIRRRRGACACCSRIFSARRCGSAPTTASPSRTSSRSPIDSSRSSACVSGRGCR
jgi:hypothetical protein